MSAETAYHDGSSWVDISGRVPLEGWELREETEEGESGTSTISVADQDLDFAPHGHRPFRVLEPTSEIDDDIVVQGFTWNDDSGRGQEGSAEFDPYARSIAQQVNDANAIWQRPVMRGSDCNRPDETDVARVQWLLSTNEYAIFDDVTTYVHTDATHNMDANDYRGQTGDQVMRDCAEESGKNWWAKYINNGATRDLVAWYGRDSHSTYDSPLFLSNDPAQLIEADMLAGTSLIWPGQDWKVNRDYTRIYCGIYAQYDGGATFRHNSTTHATYFGDPGPDSHRVMVVPMPNVHRLATAQRRADRMLADIGDPDIHVSATVRLPAAKVTQLRAGMRVPIFLTHEPEFNDGWKWCRIVNATPKPVAAGSQYDVAIEATPTGPPDSAGPVTPPSGATSGGILYEPGDHSDSAGTEFQIFWGSNGDDPGLGYGARLRDATSFNYIGTRPEQEGWEILASAATLDLAIQTTLSDAIVSPSRTYTFQLRLNGTTIASDAYTKVGSGGVFHTFNINVSDLAVVAGDLLTTWFTYSELANPAVAAGTGDLSNHFEILNTSLVSP